MLYANLVQELTGVALQTFSSMLWCKLLKLFETDPVFSIWTYKSKNSLWTADTFLDTLLRQHHIKNIPITQTFCMNSDDKLLLSSILQGLSWPWIRSVLSHYKLNFPLHVCIVDSFASLPTETVSCLIWLLVKHLSSHIFKDLLIAMYSTIQMQRIHFRKLVLFECPWNTDSVSPLLHIGLLSEQWI